jgi:hypothetical protein
MDWPKVFACLALATVFLGFSVVLIAGIIEDWMEHR